MDKVAIVILNWNGVKMLTRYMDTLLEHSRGEATVYVADNASTDQSVPFLKEHYPEVRLIQLEKNWGFADGYNKALQQVEATYYVILNSDVEVTPHWLTPLITFMDDHEEVAACQPKLLSVANREAFEYAGACGGFIDKYGYPFCRGRLFDSVEDDKGQYDDICEVMWATGACLIIRSADYWKVNGFDGRFFAHNEEIDLCWRLRMMGRKVYCIPDSFVYHVGGGTLPKGNPMKTYLNFRNNLTMLYKNLPDKELRHVMRWRWLLDYVAAYETLLVNRNVGDFKAIYRARRDFKRWRKDFRQERSELQRIRVVPVVAERKPISLLWQYYFKGKRRFSELPQ
ncbi:MAG: glycosyltransferase family 2 protein [Prevotella sp.]|nr:glycosyltransferase family 2 protein [Prevotella sp.]